jgi:hypothetical protein
MLKTCLSWLWTSQKFASLETCVKFLQARSFSQRRDWLELLACCRTLFAT